MADERNQKSSNLPFTPIPVSPAKSSSGGKQLKSKGYSQRKQLKRAKKTNDKLPINVPRVALGLVILLVISATATAIFAPQKLEAIVSGDFLEKTETCTVTETNSSNFFDTTCGKFEWKDDLAPVTFPQNELVEGETYVFESVGLRIGPAQVFPSVLSHTPAN